MRDARRAGVPAPYTAHRMLLLSMAKTDRVEELIEAWDHLRQCKMRPDEEVKAAMSEALLRAGRLQTIADLGEHQSLGYAAAEKLMRWSRQNLSTVRERDLYE